MHQAMIEEKVLIVDDEEDICEVLSISLSDLGYKVYTAGNGEEALQVFEKTKPSIVLTDIRMPGIDGIELLRRIKDQYPETEVIMITGHGDMNLAIRSLKLEATDFITKPINDELLEIALKRAEERISSRKKLEEYTQNLEELVREKSEKLVQAERLIAVGEVVDGLASAMRNITEDFEGDLPYFNELPCLVSIHNRDYEIVAVNDLYKRRLGDRAGCKSWDVYHEASDAREMSPVIRTFKTGRGHRSRETLIDIQGKEFPVIVHTAPIRNKNKEVELVLEISADLMEVNRLQEELRASQERYQQLFDAVPCYISVHDRDLKLVATNKRFKEDFGESGNSFCYELYKHRNDPCPECPVVKTFEEGISQQYETVVTSQSGEAHNVLIWTAPIRNTLGEITQVMEVSTDITQIRKLQNHLASLGLVLGSVSHGIKGLLAGLDASIYWLDSGLEKKNDERMGKGLSALKLMTRRIRNMVLNLLYYAKERELNRERTNVLAFAHDVANAFMPKLQDQSIRFVRDFQIETGEFEADTGVLSSALVNILENAVEACLEDKSKADHDVVFSVKEEENVILFKISDNGVGMDRETMDNMFTLFFSSKGSRGTGLGLFISNEIVQQHGGSIKVESAPGRGTEFKITLPKKLPD
jgi:signal transduction histidine kinase/FixJ family two-component response regulator